jgi:hypothetical protein
MRLVFLSVAIIAACDPYVASEVLLAPSPNPAAWDSTGAGVIALIDTLAKRHGLKPEKWPYSCDVGSSQGTREGTWRSSSTWLSVCVARVSPHRVHIFMKEPGFRWSPGGDSLRQELPDSLRVRFGLAAVTVVRK